MDGSEYLGHYNRITASIGQTPRSGANAEREAAAFLVRAAELGVDPLGFTAFRHRAPLGSASATIRVPLRKLVNNAEVARYRANPELWEARAYQEVGRARDVRSVEVEPADGLTIYTERLKEQFASQPARCAVARDTRGWHPLSRWCVACTAREACQSRMEPVTMIRRSAYAGG